MNDMDGFTWGFTWFYCFPWTVVFVLAVVMGLFDDWKDYRIRRANARELRRLNDEVARDLARRQPPR